MNDKQHCRCCGAELVECDECHGTGNVQVDGPMDQETGQRGYTEDCSECSGRGGYAAPQDSGLRQALHEIVDKPDYTNPEEMARRIRALIGVKP